MLYPQSWRLHVETDHVDGRHLVSRKWDPDQAYPCTNCAFIAKTRSEREFHRRSAHNMRTIRSEQKVLLRERKAEEKLLKNLEKQERRGRATSTARPRGPIDVI